MNTITRVFIVLNFFLAGAVGFVVPVTYAYQENYKRRWVQDVSELKQDLRQANNVSLRESFQKRRAEMMLQTVTSERNLLVTEKEQLQSDITRYKGEIAQYSTTVDKINTTLDAQREHISQLQSSLELERQRRSELNKIAQVSRAVAFQLNVKLAEVEDDLNNAESELTRRERTIFDLEEDLTRRNATLALVKERYPQAYQDVTSGTPQADDPIRAVVAAVRTNPQGQQDLVMLTVGGDEGIREGVEFIIYRGNEYIVKVRAERVMGDMVACRVIPETWNARGAQIQQGDKAQNRLF